MMLDDAGWCLMTLDDTWCHLMTLDDTWWHLMTFDDTWWPKGLLDPKIGDEMITHFLYLIFKDFSYWKSDLMFHHVRKCYLDLVISPYCAILDFWFHNVAQYKIWLFHHVVQYRNLYFTMLCNIRFGDSTIMLNNLFSFTMLCNYIVKRKIIEFA